MSASKYLRVNPRQVIHEIFDDEVVIVNLETGSYYSLTQVGTAIWRLLEQGIDEHELAQSIAQQYQGNKADISESVTRFIGELVQESLVQSSPESAPHSQSERQPQNSNGKLPFQAPVLNKYTDMEELLLLDPIHEVDEMGWPIAKTDPP